MHDKAAAGMPDHAHLEALKGRLHHGPASDAPRRRPSNAGPMRWRRGLAGTTAATCIALTLLFGRAFHDPTTTSLASRADQGWCAATGLVSPPQGDEADRHRLTVVVRPGNDSGPQAPNQDNTILPDSFHPVLAAQRDALLNKTATALPVNTSVAGQCVEPPTQFLPLLPRPSLSLEHSSRPSPELFFALCTTPKRAVEYSPLWRHFMSGQEDDPLSAAGLAADGGDTPSSTSAGCLVTDAAGQGDAEGLALANAEFRRLGLSCTMRDSSRAGQRYEMRVLGMVNDAWEESERRRTQEGAPPVEWFVFGDDDTWFTDPAMLRETLAGYDSSEPHILGSFSETRSNYDAFGRIVFGGAGFAISRALMSRMQPLVDECSTRFARVYGGDGIISHCAALLLDVPLPILVDELPGLRQMDIRGDATGYMTAGTAPFLSLHHWTGWLTLVPGVPGKETIELFAKAVTALGGPNFLRRWVFDGGLVVFTAGYSVQLHRNALTEEDLERIEWTWKNHEPRRLSRRKQLEGREKITYYLTAVEELEPGLTRLRHTSSLKTLQDGVREIDVLLDTRSERRFPWWDRWRLG